MARGRPEVKRLDWQLNEPFLLSRSDTGDKARSVWWVRMENGSTPYVVRYRD
jgi:hypothetical protein